MALVQQLFDLAAAAPAYGPGEPAAGAQPSGEPAVPAGQLEEAPAHGSREPAAPAHQPDEAPVHPSGEPGVPAGHLGEALAHGSGEPAAAADQPEEAVILADRADGTVVRVGPVVAKAHPAGGDPRGLAARLGIAAHPLLAGILLPPLATGTLGDGRTATCWAYGTPVAPDDPDAAPWEETAVLLARLHSVPVAALPGPVPAMRGPAKVAGALARLRAAGPPAAADAVLRAAATLPGWARGEPPARAVARPAADPPDRSGPETGGGAAVTHSTLCHGDLHLGQLVRCPEWLLIDVDDLGLGDPAWDLARPAAWYATGLLDPEAWSRFLGAYRAAGGPAVPAGGDPWPRLDVPARALTVQSAALALAKAAAEGRAPDEAEAALVDACVRIAKLLAEPGSRPETSPIG